jgi:hypothetical protein
MIITRRSLTQKERDNLILRRRKLENELKKEDSSYASGKSDEDLRDEQIIYNPKSSKEDVRKAKIRLAVSDAAALPIGALTTGAGLALVNGADKNSDITNTRAGLIGAAYGTAVGAGVVGYQALKRNLKSNKIRSGKGSEEFKEKMERRSDVRKVALGEMTTNEFKNKWYNKK